MFAIRRSCAAALRTSSAPNGTRAFSRSAVCQRGGLPVFVTPSSPELSTLLATFNSKILLPAHLTKDQEKLVYSKAGQAKLNTEPVDVTVGDVTLPLEPLDRNKLPARTVVVRHIIGKSTSSEDWENVIRAIEGLESAGIPVRPHWQQLVVRMLGKHNMYNLLLKTLQRPKATTMRLSNLLLLRSVIRSAHDRAAGTVTGSARPAAWDQEETAAALRFATQVVELMEDPEHHSVKPPNALVPHTDLRGRPSVVALPTELAAVAAERHGADREPVKTYAARLMAAIEQSEFTAEIDRIAATKITGISGTARSDSVTAFCHDLAELVVVWNALATSRRVLGTDMPQADAAAQYEKRLKSVLEQGVVKAEEGIVLNGEKMSIFYPQYIKNCLQVCAPAKQ
jgi:hypothetical protein